VSKTTKEAVKIKLIRDEKMPKRMNTVEKPMINAEEFKIVSFLINALFPVLKSSKEIPVMKDTYDGMRGRIHGERKDRNPAIKANE